MDAEAEDAAEETSTLRRASQVNVSGRVLSAPVARCSRMYSREGRVDGDFRGGGGLGSLGRKVGRDADGYAGGLAELWIGRSEGRVNAQPWRRTVQQEKEGTHSLAEGDTGGELLGRAGRDHALRDALDEGVGRAQALVVGRGARGDSGRLPNAVDDAASMSWKEVSCMLASETDRVALGTHQVGGAPCAETIVGSKAAAAAMIT